MKEYVVRHLKDDGTEGAVIGTAPDVDRARALGDEQAADPDYPWYTISVDLLRHLPRRAALAPASAFDLPYSDPSYSRVLT